MKKILSVILFLNFNFNLYSQVASPLPDTLSGHIQQGDPAKFSASMRKDVTSGYYLGFTSLADELRDLRRPSNIPVTNNFLKSFYFDFHYAHSRVNMWLIHYRDQRRTAHTLLQLSNIFAAAHRTHASASK